MLKKNNLIFTILLISYNLFSQINCNSKSITTNLYSETENLDVAVQNEFGQSFQLADWDDLKALPNIDDWISCMNLQHDDAFILKKNGARFYNSGSRHYYAHYSTDGLPYPNFAVHDQIGNKLFLGSWYGLNMKVLGEGTTTNIQEYKGWHHQGRDMAYTFHYPHPSIQETDNNLVLKNSISVSGSKDLLTGDINGDGKLELVTVQSNILYIISSTGTVLSSTDVAISGQNGGGNATMIADANGDGKLNIGIGYNPTNNNYKQFKSRIYNGNGTMLKEFTKAVNADGFGMTPIAVIDGDVIIAQNAGYGRDPRGFSRWDFDSGNEIWQYDVGPAFSRYSIADIDNDGKMEMAWGNGTVHNGASGNDTNDGNNYTIIVDEDGNEELTQIYPGSTNRDGSIRDMFVKFSENEPYRILTQKFHDPRYYQGTSRLHVRDIDGTILSTFNGANNAGWRSSVCDINNDGNKEIFATNYSGTTFTQYVLDKNLNVLNSSSEQGYLVVTNDINGDGDIELILRFEDTIKVLDKNLTLIESYQLGGTITKAIVSDTDNNGINEIIVLADKIYILEMDAVNNNSQDYFTTQFFDLNDNQIPNGWNLETIRSADISNGRINAYIVDGSARLEKEASVNPNTNEIILELDGHLAYSYWGLVHGFYLYDGAETLGFRIGAEEYEFPGDNYFYEITNTMSGTTQKITTGTNTRIDGIYSIKLIMNDNGYNFIGYDANQNEIFNSTILDTDYFNFRDINKIRFATSAHTDNSGWIDNLRITVNTTITNNDNTSPVIALIGDNPQTIEIGNSYTELGATASDNVDGDISNNIVINASSVNTNTIGTYEVTYNVSDATGNNATQVTRTVNIVANPNFTLNENGVTCECENAAIGEQGTLTINGVQKTFTKRTEQQLRDLIAADENDPQIALTCTSGITDMSWMFGNGTSNFNQNIGNWDVSSVSNMEGMFNGATNFNQDIGFWNVSNVSIMTSMFSAAENFNQNIGNWDVSSVTNMRQMFSGALVFNQSIGDWDVSSVTNLNSMFFNANEFNQPIGNWNVSSVLDMAYMLIGAASFNQDIGSWNVSNVTDMTGLFASTSNFNQDLSNWCVSNILSEPNSFATGSALQISFKPKWGTCPNIENFPTATDDSYTIDEADTVRIRPLSKSTDDTDPNRLDLRIFSIDGQEIDYNNLPQTIQISNANNIVGVVNFNAIDEILFTPKTTGTIIFPYVIKNTNNLSATANQIIEVIPLPEGEKNPIAVNDVYTVKQDEVLKIRPLKKGIDDSDPNHLELSIFSIAGIEIEYNNLPQTINVMVADNLVGSVNFNTTDEILFTPSSSGTITFPYVIKNTLNATATANQIIEVIPVPEGADNPIASNDTYTTKEGEILKIRPLTKGTDDADPNRLDLRIYTIAGEEIDYDNLPQSIDVLMANSKVGVVNFNAIDEIEFIPSATGTITFPYEIKNTNDLSATANQIIEVTPLPEGEKNPTATNDSYSIKENEALKIRPLKKGLDDSDPNDLALSIFSIAGEEIEYDNLPQSINVMIANNIVGVVNFNTTDEILFTPSTSGTITFPYVIKNTLNATATASQIIEVIPIPEGADNPIAIDDYYTMDFGEDLTIRPLSKGKDDTDPNRLDLRVFSIAGEEIDYNNLPQSIDILLASETIGIVHFNDVNDITFSTTVNSPNSISFPYTIKNTDDLESTANQFIEIMGTAISANSPNAIDDTYTVRQGESLEIKPLTRERDDTDPNDLPLRVVKFGDEEVSGNEETIEVNNGSITIDENNSFVFTPNPSFFGTLSFTYTISNTNDFTDVGLVTIIVDKSNTSSSAPIATDDLYTIQKNEIGKLNPLKTGRFDSTPDGSALKLSYIHGEEVFSDLSTIKVPNGKVIINNYDDIRFVPNTDYVGNVIFSYEISNSNGESDTGIQSIDVTESNALSINENLKDSFILYPNPANDKLRIKSNNSIRKTQIFSLLGKKMLELKTQKEIDISKLPSAIYFLKVYTSKGVGIRKFIKN